MGQVVAFPLRPASPEEEVERLRAQIEQVLGPPERPPLPPRFNPLRALGLSGLRAMARRFS